MAGGLNLRILNVNTDVSNHQARKSGLQIENGKRHSLVHMGFYFWHG
jgi:hypothetical protein